jgi:hypothetical protein
MKHRYKVTARCWGPAPFWPDQDTTYLPISRFGPEEPAYVELDDTEVVELIMKFGRATIEPGSDSTGDYRTLSFENDYD